ncbi:MAG: hypothetical protein N3A61_06010, partial [Ignavibacteria bacterium]|nr:hypothetical protein [Ignavibacteria bacterium]
FIWNFFFLISIEYVWRILFRMDKILKQILFSFYFVLSIIGYFVINFSSKELLHYLVVLFLIFSISFYQYNIFNWSRSLWVTSFSLFTIIWSYVLTFGSNNKFLIKSFFAKNYDSWEGLLTINLIKEIPIEVFISIKLIIFSVILYLISKRKIKPINA